MSFNSWNGVPAGMPVHHHCVMSLESKHDPKFWVDGSQETPHLVAWQPQDALEWIWNQIAAYKDQTVEHYGRRALIEDAFKSYRKFEDLPPVTAEEIPDRWSYTANTLQVGRWVMPTFCLSMGKLLVMQVLCFADSDQPSGVNGQSYAICRSHQRPEEKPYQGLTEAQTAHFQNYRTLYTA